jgi:hypothetical protein
MGLLARIRRQMSVVSGARGSGMRDPMALQRKRPGVLFGVGMMEFGQLASGRVDGRLKTLASVKTSALVGCPF